jgi:hypothetical protein
MLYQKFYGGQPAHYHNTDTVIAQADLEGVDQDVARADVIYLQKSGLIEGLGQLGTAYPIHIKITNYGIDAVESIVDDALNNLADSNDYSIKSKVKEIIAEKNPPNKIKKFVDYVKQHPDWVASTLEKIIRAALGGGAT